MFYYCQKVEFLRSTIMYIRYLCGHSTRLGGAAENRFCPISKKKTQNENFG